MARVFCDKTHRFRSVGAGGGEEERVRDASMFVNSFNVEFGYELISALPYAYYLHQQGLLEGTESGVDTQCLYYFSPKHTINNTERKWDNMQKARKLPNIRIHRNTLDNRFSPPPLKEAYSNSIFVWDKPTICIFNRVNSEWNKGAINYFDIDFLRYLFETLSPHYKIIYFNIRGKQKYYDGPMPIDIGDYELAREMGITLIHDLHQEHQDITFNELQLMVMANCEKFISVNGGYSILASYMGGTNIIYSKECQELKPEVNSFYRWYHKFGGSRILHESTYEGVFRRVEEIFIDKLPLINIITRTCNRPNCFDVLYRSVKAQTYQNVNMIVGLHDDKADKYLIPYKVQPVRYEEYTRPIPTAGDQINYGKPFPSNHYMNRLFSEVKEGYVMCLDDDDAFQNKHALAVIAGHIKSEDDLILWRIDINGRLIPSNENFGHRPVVQDISGIAFCCHHKHLKGYHCEPYRRFDYRLISHLYEKLNPVWIDEVLTKTQIGPGYGKRKDREAN